MLNQSFAFPITLLLWDKKVIGKLNAGKLQYSLKLFPSTILYFCFAIVTHIFTLFTYFSNPHVPNLVSGILVEDGL